MTIAAAASPGATAAFTSPAGGIYIHVPFCSAICPYCDFAVVRSSRNNRKGFEVAIARELALVASPDWQIDTIYFGGGTPSALEPEQLADIVAAVGGAVTVLPGTAVYFEANPEDVTPERLWDWRDLGVEFLSLGVQSFDDQRLRYLGRRHDGAAARLAVERAVDSGIATVNVDVIYALPGEGEAASLRDFEAAASLGANHLSAYELTIKEGTPFARRRARGHLVELGEGQQADLLEGAFGHLERLGFEGYEVSNFSRGAQHRSRHNQKYWHGAPYLGLGPSAHSFDGSRRWWNHRDLTTWSAALERGEIPRAQIEVLAPAERALEQLMLGLRTRAGVDLRAFAASGGRLDPRRLEDFARAGLVQVVGDRLQPSVRGMALADRLAVELSA